MPKKFKGVNSKAEEARVRRESVKVAEREKKQKEEEDSYWQDNDKHVQRKQKRKVSCSTAVLLGWYIAMFRVYKDCNCNSNVPTIIWKERFM